MSIDAAPGAPRRGRAGRPGNGRDRPRVALAIAAAAALAACAGPAAAAPSGQEQALSVAELSRARPTEGMLTLDGWIASSYRCPTCPPGAHCKPCLGDHVTVADARPRDAKELAPDQRVVVFVERADLARLVVGERYRLRVRVRATRTTGSVVNDLQLVELEARH